MTATTDGNHMKPQAQCFSSMEGAEMEAVPSKKRKPFVLRIRRAEGGPKKPKGRMSAFAFFIQRCREEHKKRSPEVPINLIEFSKTCAGKWKTMSPKEKSEFDKMAKADKVRYDQEMEAYAPPKTDRKKDSNPPRRPPSAFFLFCSASRPKIKSTNPGISMGDVAKKLAEMWINLSDHEKQPYNYKAAQLMEKYEKDVADYKSKGKSDGEKGLAKICQLKVEEEDAEKEKKEKKDEEEEEKKEEEEEKKKEVEKEEKKEEEEKEKKEAEEEKREQMEKEKEEKERD